ncbi:MAG: HAMP domain-containing sensor histidine kinase [Bacteroidota bacterium]
MNKKAIWIIIGLMSAALIGIILLQMYWIRQATERNEAQFDTKVFLAMNKVSERIQNAEDIQHNIEAYRYINSQTSTSLIKQEMYQYSLNSDRDNFVLDIALGQYAMDDSLFKANLLGHYQDENHCNCAQCRRERFERYELREEFKEKQLFNKLFNPKPIDQRMDLRFLDVELEQELQNHGIEMPYNYGVFSNNDDSFVIRDGHFVVQDNSPLMVPAGTRNLYNSKYRVNLFPRDVHSPGLLMIHFPTKASFVWGSVWKILLGSILFTGIILFCFTYTIQVIFRQKKLSEMKTDFINNMTHEFKTPIATISLATDSICNPMILSNANKVERFADIIRQENKRMNSQVEKVLQMAQIDKRDFQLKVTDINIHDVIRQAVQNASLQVEKKDGTVSAELEAEHPTIEGDLTHVSNIIHNLLDNANKYSPESPEISVHTRNVPSGVEVIVKDKGIGMGKEAKKHIFDKFYRVHTGDIHNVKGFGLGLSYVKAMMTAHKGQIDVKSELGKGSSFILIFPRYIAE